MIKWTPALSTGIDVLDEHHKVIFQWVAELESAASEQRTLFGAYAITRLKHDAEAHFAAEEAFMREVDYPQLSHHISEHAVFRVKLEQLLVKCITQDISTESVQFLRAWLTNHIVKTDMAYVPYLANRCRV